MTLSTKLYVKRRTDNTNMGKRIITKGELQAANASSIIGEVLAELPSVKAERVSGAPTVTFKNKRTHKSSEPKAKPRSFRFAVSVERRMKKAQRELGVRNQTTFVEAAIIAACRKLGIK